MQRILTSLPEPRDMFRRTLIECVSTNPQSARWLVALMALYLHLGPFSRVVVAQIDGLIGRHGRVAIDQPAPTALPSPTLVM
jgi:hypothetical protein